MAGNNLLRLLRGSETSAETILKPGQPFYNYAKNYLTVGGKDENGNGITPTNGRPLAARELVGYAGDTDTAIGNNATELFKIHYAGGGISFKLNGVEKFKITSAGAQVTGIDLNNIESSTDLTLISATNKDVIIKSGSTEVARLDGSLVDIKTDTKIAKNLDVVNRISGGDINSDSFTAKDTNSTIGTIDKPFMRAHTEELHTDVIKAQWEQNVQLENTVLPKTTNSIDMGSSLKRFNNIFGTVINIPKIESAGDLVLGVTDTSNSNNKLTLTFTYNKLLPSMSDQLWFGDSSHLLKMVYADEVTAVTALTVKGKIVGTTNDGIVVAHDIMPLETNDLNLGSSSKYFSNAHIDTVNVRSSILPDSNSGADVGSSSKYFAHSYILNMHSNKILPDSAANSTGIGEASNTFDYAYVDSIYTSGLYNKDEILKALIRIRSGSTASSTYVQSDYKFYDLEAREISSSTITTTELSIDECIKVYFNSNSGSYKTATITNLPRNTGINTSSNVFVPYQIYLSLEKRDDNIVYKAIYSVTYIPNSNSNFTYYTCPKLVGLTGYNVDGGAVTINSSKISTFESYVDSISVSYEYKADSSKSVIINNISGASLTQISSVRSLNVSFSS